MREHACDWNVGEPDVSKWGNDGKDYRACGKPAVVEIVETEPCPYSVWLCEEHKPKHLEEAL